MHYSCVTKYARLSNSRDYRKTYTREGEGSPTTCTCICLLKHGPAGGGGLIKGRGYNKRSLTNPFSN
jgi:hypothetical protein